MNTVYDIARALLFRVQLDEIEAMQQDPGKGNWSIILKSNSTAKKLAKRGFILLEQQVFPTPYNAALSPATIAFVPPGTTPDDILAVLGNYAEVKQILPIFLKDFPSIKSGTYRVMLKGRLERFYLPTSPHTGVELHSFTQARLPGARIATQPLTLKKRFQCDQFSHVRAECSNIIQPDNDENSPGSEASTDHNSENNNITIVAEDSTLVENSAELFTQPPVSDKTTTEGHDSSQDSDPSGSTSSTHDQSPDAHVPAPP